MILHTKRSIKTVILFTFSVYLLKYCNGYLSDEKKTRESDDDDNTLREALILVDLLKTEYLNVLRENNELRSNNNDDEDSTLAEEQSTCAPTVSDGNSTLAGTQDNDTVNEVPTPARPSESLPSPPPLPPPPPPLQPSPPLQPPPPLLPPPPVQPPPLLQPSPPLQPPPPMLEPPLLPLYGTPYPIPIPLGQNLQDSQHPYGYYRRRIPAEYYYYDAPMRKFLDKPSATMVNPEYEEANNFRRYYPEGLNKIRRYYYPNNVFTPDHNKRPIKMRRNDYPDNVIASTSDPNQKASPFSTTTEESDSGNLTTEATTTSTSRASTILASSTTSSSNITTSSTKTTTSSINTTTATKTNLFKTGFKKVKRPIMRPPNDLRSGNKTEKDPVMVQVVSELMNELKDDSALRTNSSETKLGKQQNSNNKSPDDPVFVRPRTTLRIHMAHSTRFPLPLPENNAFCYFSPRNPLCGTFV